MAAEPRDAANASRQDVGDVVLRKSVWALDEEEVAALREAFGRSQALSDSRGYGHFASLHGFPDPGYCEHRNQLFLPWHRAYLYFFEQSLQDLVPGVALPWWDWTEAAELSPLLAEERDPAGEPNPLFSAAIVAAGGYREPGWPERTSRDPGVQGRLPTTEDVDAVEAAADFDDLTFRLEQVHNAVHMWVGGEMTDQRFARPAGVHGAARGAGRRHPLRRGGSQRRRAAALRAAVAHRVRLAAHSTAPPMCAR